MATENELLYFDTLKRIARDFMTPAQLRRKGEQIYGLPYEEALEMAYENMQSSAAAAIHGKRAPKASTGETE